MKKKLDIKKLVLLNLPYVFAFYLSLIHISSGPSLQIAERPFVENCQPSLKDSILESSPTALKMCIRDRARRTVNTRRYKAYRLLKKLMGGEADD